MSTRITFVPVGGLGNRIRSMASAIRLARDCGAMLHIIWFQDWGMGCRFCDLFQPIDLNFVSITEATRADLLLRDRPRRKNLWLPYVPEKIAFDDCLYESCTHEHARDFRQFAINRNTYITSCYAFYKSDENSFYDLFQPTPPLTVQINEVVATFPPCTIGVQIRRADHAGAIAQSPTALFEAKMHTEPDAHFYLCTDAPEEKERLCSLFGHRIICTHFPMERGSREGVQYALVEMFSLSKTCQIWGSYTSSFGTMAAKLGGVPYTQIAVDSPKA